MRRVELKVQPDLKEEDVFGAGGLLADRDGDGFPESWGGWIVLPRRGPARIYAAAAEMAARAGQDLAALDGPAACFQDELAGVAQDRECLISLVGADPDKVLRLVRSVCGANSGRQAQMGERSPSADLLVNTLPNLDLFWSSESLGQATEDDAASFFPIGHCLAIRVPDGEMDGDDGKALVEFAARYGLESAGLEYPVVFVGEDPVPEGRPVVRLVVAARPAGETAGGSVRFLGEGVVEADAGGLRRLAELPSPSDPVTWMAKDASEAGPPRGERLVSQGEMGWPWEVDEVQALFQREVLSRVQGTPAAGLTVEIEARVSETLEIRQRLERQWREALRRAGVAEGRLKVKVRSAYKQGLTWIQEEVVPAVRGLAGKAAKAEVAFRSFVAPEGEKWLELPTRWLQELYPSDEVLGAALGLPWGRVGFVQVEEGGSGYHSTYQITVTGEGGEILYQDTFEASYAERPYLQAFPEAGKVHPGTGFFRWRITDGIGGRAETGLGPAGEIRVATDSERFWDYFQSEILPAATKYVLDGKGDKQPFFRSLDVHVWMSEPDDGLGVREERLSPLEALHEDIYFVALDHFAHLGRQLTGTPFRSPGLVVPWIHRADGEPPRCQFSLKAWDAASGEAPGGPPQGAELRNAPMEEVIDRGRLEEVLRFIERRPGVRVHLGGRSFLGEPSYVVEVALPARGRIARRKLSLLKPTYVLVARHHANEVSSTNSALKLAELLTGDDERYTRYLRGLNLVIIPFENVDGAALHFQLQQEHPTWKLHAGRFNAAGQDLAAEYWKEGTAFGESAVLPRVWRTWLPDMVGDDHGVPSHEWEQPFSGYVCPWFSSFWLPRAHFYGYLSYLQEEGQETPGGGDLAEDRGGGRYAAHRALVEAVRERMAAAIDGDGDIAALNRVWKDRYQKYGTAWLPDRFPAKENDFYRNVLIYWTALKPSPAARNLAARFPEVTALSWVAEVNDETAQGPYLELCARAHLLADLAVFDVMLEADRRATVDVVDCGDGRAMRVWRRPRPLRVQ